MFSVGSKIFEEQLKRSYAGLAAILGCTVTEQWKRIYMCAVETEGGIKLLVYFLSESGRYLNPRESAPSLTVLKIINDNFVEAQTETKKIFDLFKKQRQKFFMMLFTVDRQGEFETDFLYRKDFPKEADDDFFFVYFRYHSGLPIDSGSNDWIQLSAYLNSKKYKNRSKQIKKEIKH